MKAKELYNVCEGKKNSRKEIFESVQGKRNWWRLGKSFVIFKTEFELIIIIFIIKFFVVFEILSIPFLIFDIKYSSVNINYL